MAAEDAHHAQQSFELLAPSQAASADTQHTQESSKQSKHDAELNVSARLAAPTAYMLPVELLLEMFAKLNTADMRVVTQVCRTWRDIANGNARLWRKLGFTAAFGMRSSTDALFAQAQLRAVVEKAEKKVVSVDVTNLPCHAIVTLCRMLYSSALTLRHILWSASSPLSDAAEDVYKLAKRCPRLQTLELRCTHQTWSLRHKFTQQECGGLRLDSFSISIPILLDEYGWKYPPIVYDNARVVSVTVEVSGGYPHSLRHLVRLLERSSVLERLTLHGLWEPIYVWPGDDFAVPALKYLNIRESDFADTDDEDDWDPEDGPLFEADIDSPVMNAPQLRELVADARLVCRLTSNSIASLESLVVHIGACRYHRPERERYSLETIKQYQASLKLVVAARGASQASAILSSEFFWPGLKEVDIELGEGSAGTLVRVIAARQAGARGASKEQYMSFFQEAPSQRMTGTPSDNRQRRLTPNLGLTPRVNSTDITSIISSIRVSADNSPLCSDVAWKIKAPAYVPVGVVNWLRAQSNVELTEGS